jgi:hypothetical protein
MPISLAILANSSLALSLISSAVLLVGGADGSLSIVAAAAPACVIIK